MVSKDKNKGKAKKSELSFIFEPYPGIVQALNAYLDEAIQELSAPLAPENTEKATQLTYEEWAATEEARIHQALISNYIIPNPNLTATQANRIYRQIRFRCKETRGRPKVYSVSPSNAKLRRALQLFFINKLLASALGVSSKDWPTPIDSMLVDEKQSQRLTTLDMLRRFEKWTGFRLPQDAWLIYTRDERVELSKQFPTKSKESDGGIAFKLYEGHVKGTYKLLDEAA